MIKPNDDARAIIAACAGLIRAASRDDPTLSNETRDAMREVGANGRAACKRMAAVVRAAEAYVAAEETYSAFRVGTTQEEDIASDVALAAAWAALRAALGRPAPRDEREGGA